MQYKKLKDYPEFSENPFMESALSSISEKSVRKREFINGNRSIINHVISDDGEIVGHSAFFRTSFVDEDKFVKLFISKFAAFYDLSRPSIKIFGYILDKCLLPNRDDFFITYEEAQQYTGYQSFNIIRTGLSGLVENKIIARSTSPYRYFLNPLVVFNGDRVSFAETYVKKRKSKKIDTDYPKELKINFDFKDETK